MDYRAVIQKIYEELEQNRVENAVMHCLRLARGIRDQLWAAIFLRETGADGKELARTLHEDWKDLNEKAVQFIVKRSVDYWLTTHTLDFSLGRDDKGDEMNVLAVSIAEIDTELELWERSINDFAVPSGMAPYDTAAFTHSNIKQKSEIRLRMKALQTVKQRVKTRCMSYATGIERQLDVQQKPDSFLRQIQNEVNNYFKGRSEDVFSKLQKAAQLVESVTSEDRSLLLTQVRRAIKAAADYFYPPKAGKTLCSDGIERELSDDRYLNRLDEYLATTFPKSSSNELLRAELDYLSAFAHRLNDLASKGVHAEVAADEAKQGLLGLYIFLYNVISKLQHAPATNQSSE